jgi:hypothetical protein
MQQAQILELRTALHRKIPAVQRRHPQLVLLRESGVAQLAIVGVTGGWLSTVHRAHIAYDGQVRRSNRSRSADGSAKT